ncbi:MAG: alpha-L-fucosidase [Clostridia bacterium]|nr:alpha-L-fucosidase [Clostridia bacterium]
MKKELIIRRITMTHQNRFGMFVHWGIYALTGVQEQVFARMDMDRDQYEALAKRFDPQKFDPDKWVLLARDAGMEYVCFTAKHHDGFCMWDTAYSDYKITNTPYGKDVLKMLADSCARHGMKLSVYYSCPDWHHPFGFNPASSHQWKALSDNGTDPDKYLSYVRDQVRELCSNYGPLYTFFWDIPPKIDDPSLNELIRSLQPGIFINDRGYSKGDFSTPERDYTPASGVEAFTRMTEACNSVGEQSWGYRKNEDFFTLRYLTGSIDRMMARGASYLLNVGPDASGKIPEEYASRIRRVGDWYKRMEGALCCHEEDKFDYGVKGGVPIVTRKDGKTYFHFPDGLCSSAFSLRRFPCLPRSVRLLNTGKELSFAYEPLPEFFSEGRAKPYLHITGIPSDELASEAIVIEVIWR